MSILHSYIPLTDNRPATGSRMHFTHVFAPETPLMRYQTRMRRRRLRRLYGDAIESYRPEIETNSPYGRQRLLDAGVRVPWLCHHNR